MKKNGYFTSDTILRANTTLREGKVEARISTTPRRAAAVIRESKRMSSAEINRGFLTAINSLKSAA